MYEAHFSHAQKAVILSSILREHHEHGHDLRDCCRAQGIQLQTFNKWRNQARSQSELERLNLHGPEHDEHDPHEPNGNLAVPDEAPPPEVNGNCTHYTSPHGLTNDKRREAPKTAIQLALERARAATLPEHDPDDEEPEPERGPALGPSTTPTPPEVSMAEPTTEPPRRTAAERMADTLAARFPWLAKLEERTAAKIGYPKPAPNASGGTYQAWTKLRAELMTDKQREAWQTFYARARPDFKTKEQLALAQARAEAPPKPAKAPTPAKLGRPPKVNGHAAPLPDYQLLAEQRAEVERTIAAHPATVALAVLSEPGPRHQPHSNHEAELDRLRRALAVLTLENLQLRGLL